MQLNRVKGPTIEGRNAMYFANGQEKAYQLGAYDYLESIAMVPRMATLGAYLNRLGIKSVLDIGCGTAEIVPYLSPDITYIGIDISETAIATAKKRYKGRKKTHFYATDFRDWRPPQKEVEAILWAGIGCTWTLKGSRGNTNDWLGILGHAESILTKNGYLVFELVTPHWPSLQKLIEGRYEYQAGCDLDCFQSEESPRRSIRIFKTKDNAPIPVTLKHEGSSLIPGHIAASLIELAHNMGQATDRNAANLGFGNLYYGLTRLYQPEVIVSIGSYRGFSSVCFSLGLSDNKKGTCYFIDPGKVDGHWHNPVNIQTLNDTFNLGGRLKHLHKTTQDAVAQKLIPSQIDLLFIDGDHSYEGVKYDFDQLSKHVSPGGLILLHDSITQGKGFTPWEVKDFIESEIQGKPEFELLTIPIASGLTIVRKRK